MNEKLLPSPLLQIMYVSREESNCPLIAEMMKLGQSLISRNATNDMKGVVSFDYGKRLLISAKDADVKTMTKQDVIEIVDYDPLKGVMMVIGAKQPCPETPVHWMVQKARADINVILQVNSTKLVEQLQEMLPMTQKERNTGSLDEAKEILKALRQGKTILLKNKGLLCCGVNVSEIHTALVNCIGTLK